MTWVGLERYGYLEEAQRLAYRFLYMFVLPCRCTNHDITYLQDDYRFRRLQWSRSRKGVSAVIP